MLDMERCEHCGEYIDGCDSDCRGFWMRIERQAAERYAETEAAYQRDVMGPLLGLGQ